MSEIREGTILKHFRDAQKKNACTGKAKTEALIESEG